MRNFLLGLSIAGAFIAGSLFSGGSPQSADAQQGVQRWEYHCTEGYNASTIMERANAAGASGWEMVSAVGSTRVAGLWCFKRPRR